MAADSPIESAVEIARRAHGELEPLIDQLARLRSPRACVTVGLLIGAVALLGEIVFRADAVRARGRRGPYRRTK